METENTDLKFAVHKKNTLYVILGLAVMVIGYILMSGGGSTDPDVFSYDIFSFRRTVLAPIVILLGFGVEIYAIMHKQK